MELFGVVVEREDSGVYSAYVAGLPVYAQGATARGAKRAIERTLQAYLRAHPDTRAARTTICVAAVTGGAHPVVQLKGPAAWLGRTSSPLKARAARINGRLGGRPRSSAAAFHGPATGQLARRGKLPKR